MRPTTHVGRQPNDYLGGLATGIRRIAQGTSLPENDSPSLMESAVSNPVIVFDVNETLLDLSTLSPIFERVFGNPLALQLWFANLILYSEAGRFGRADRPVWQYAPLP
jgi:hypothetical protein